MKLLDIGAFWASMLGVGMGLGFTAQFVWTDHLVEAVIVVLTVLLLGTEARMSFNDLRRSA